MPVELKYNHPCKKYAKFGSWTAETYATGIQDLAKRRSCAVELNDQKLIFFKFGGWAVVALPTRLSIYQFGSWVVEVLPIRVKI